LKPSSSPANHRLEQKDATRQRIYEAARKLFIEKGYSETRSTDIATAAGVSTGSVFAHFGSKAKIMATLQQELMSAYIERIKTAGFVAKDTSSRIRELAWFLWDTHHQSPESMKVLRVAMSQTWSWDTEDEAAYQAYLAARRVALRAILEDCEDWSGCSTCGDIDFALRLFQAFHSDLIREASLRSDDEAKAMLERALRALFIGGNERGSSGALRGPNP
jgi:AcrR family transcriptional regulator